MKHHFWVKKFLILSLITGLIFSFKSNFSVISESETNQVPTSHNSSANLKIESQIKIIDDQLSKIAQSLEVLEQQETLQREITQKQSDIAKVDSLIVDTRLVISSLEKQILDNQKDIEKLNFEIKKLLLEMQTRQVSSPIKILFSNSTLGKTLGQIYNLSSLSHKIEQKRKLLQEKTENLEKTKQQNQQVNLQLESTRALLKSQQSNLEYLLAQTNGEETRYQNLIQSIEQQKKLLESQLETLNGEYIAELNGQRSLERRKNNQDGVCPFEETEILNVPRGYFGRPATGFMSQPYHCDHDGVDIANVSGSAIYAIAAGEVVRIGARNDDCVGFSCNGGFGNFILLKHDLPSGQRVFSLYAHLLTQPTLPIGQRVSKGEIIGRMGCTGYTKPYPCGVHLHFMILSKSSETMGIGCRYGKAKCYNPENLIEF